MGILGLMFFIPLLWSLREKSFQAKAFPTALLIILIAMCLLFIFRKGFDKKYDFSGIKQVLLYGGLFLIYVVILPHIGFIISTTAFISAFLILQKYPMKKLFIFIFSLAITMTLWLLFAKGFGVRLPEILF